MLLNNLLNKSYEDVLVHLERKVNNERFGADVQNKYQSYGTVSSFELPFVLIDRKDLKCFEVNPDLRLMGELQASNKIKFFIHPEMLQDYKTKNIVSLLNIESSILVSPTSSTRTVIAIGRDYPFSIKTDLERKIGDGIKRLKSSHLQHIQKIGMELEHISLDRFGYLPESFGAIFSSNRQEVGMVAREIYARPRVNGKTYLIPFFSLFSKDETSKADPLLLLQIIRNLRKNNHNEAEVCLNEIIEPYLEAWANLILQRGLSAEMHAQNTLLEIDENGNPIKVVYRDLQDTFVDPDIRRDKGLNTDFSKGVIGQNERGYKVEGVVITDRKKCKQISYSLTYDYRIGRALDYFVAAIDKNCKNAGTSLILSIKDIWKKHFADTDLFPSKAYHLQKSQNRIEEELNFIEVEPKYR